MMYGKSKKGYFVAKKDEAPATAAEAMNRTSGAAMGVSGTPGDVDPLEQFATGERATSFTQAGFKRQGSFGDKDLYAPNNFGEGGSQVVNVDGVDYTIGFLKNKQGDMYNAVLVDKTGNVRQGSTRDQAVNDMLSNFQNLNGSQVARSLYSFGISKTTSPTQKYGGGMQAVENVRMGSM